MDVLSLLLGWTGLWARAERTRETAQREAPIPPHPMARQRRLLAELRGEPSQVEDLWPAWAELERRRVRRGRGAEEEQ